jgi:catechol 2,3-dioxygenase
MAPLVRPRALGEIVLRVRDIPRAIGFYRDVLGLALMRHVEDRFAFMRIETGLEGHERIIGLFSADEPSNRSDTVWGRPDGGAPSLHHFALEIPLAEYEGAVDALTRAGLNPDTNAHRWIGWRSIYISDPDGNTVELVAADPSIRD